MSESPSETRKRREQATTAALDIGGGANVRVPATANSRGEITAWGAPELGPQQRTNRRQVWNRWRADVFGGPLAQADAAGERPGDNARMTMRGVSEGPDSTIDDVLLGLTEMTEAQISYLQRRLFQGGFYNRAVYGNAAEINWGSIDASTMAALDAALNQAAMNDVVNFDQFLENERYRFAQSGVNAEGEDIAAGRRGSRDETPVIDVVLEDPEAIRLMAESSARELLGRKPTEAELTKITAAIHARQREFQIARQRPVDGGEQALVEQANLEVGALLMDGATDMALPGASGNAVRLDQEQANIVNTMLTVADQMGLGEEYVVAAISAGLVESGLRNLRHGDRDSLGVFQQRPSQGWGSPQQINDVAYATRKFYEGMLRTANPGDLGEWVANVQRPAKQYRGRYSEQMQLAVDIYQSVRGGARVGGPQGPISANQAERRAQRGERQGRVAPGQVSIRQAERGMLPVTTIGQPDPVAREEDDGDANLWFQSIMSSSMNDPIYRESISVDPAATAEMELRRGDPVAYETRQAALRAIDFMSLLSAGGGYAGGQG